MRGGWVYIMTNRPNGTLYVGVTSDLVRRVAEHRAGEVAGFTQRYGLKRLVYFERHEEILGAISWEKAIKEWQRGRRFGWSLRIIRNGRICMREFRSVRKEVVMPAFAGMTMFSLPVYPATNP